VAWAGGWALSRGATVPVAVGEGLRIDTDPARAVARYVLAPEGWDCASALGTRVTVAGNEIKVLGATARLRAALGAEWTMYAANHLMTVPFARAGALVPPGYVARIVEDGAVLVATVRDGAGDLACSGRLAASGRYGVIDRVRTRAADQRRGLGRAVMAMLGNRALDAGLTTGLLSATSEGRALYEAVGWTVRAEVAGAFRAF